MKKSGSAGLVMAAVVLLCACGSSAQTEQSEITDSMTLSKDGGVENTITESFDKDYYSLDDLNGMIEDELTDYNKLNPNAEITLVSSGLTDGDKVQVTMSYDSAQTYSGYSGWEFYCDTIQAACGSYDLDYTLRSAKDESKTISGSEILELGEHHVVLLTFPEEETDTLRLNCYGNILYMSDNVTLVSKKSVDITPTQETSVIIFK